MIDAEAVVEGGVHLLKPHRPILDLAGDPIGRADHLPGSQAAAGEKRTGDVRPVIAAGILVDLRRPAELPPHDHRHVLVEAAAVDVVDERRHALIKLGDVLATVGEVVAVVVPEAVAERHAAHPGLDKAAGGEELLHETRGTVPLVLLGAVAVFIAHRLRLLRDIEGLGQGAGGEDAEGLLLKGIHAVHHPGAVGRAVEGVEGADEAATVAEPVEGEARENEIAGAVAIGLERGARGAEIAGLAGVVGAVLHPRREADVRGRRRACGPLELRHHRAELRMPPWRLPLMAAAGEALEGVVVAGGADERANDGKLVHHFRHPRHQLADFDARDIGRYG